MYAKLAIRNIKRSFKDYSIYFLTLVFGVAIFYTFNSIESQTIMMNLSEAEKSAFEMFLPLSLQLKREYLYIMFQ